MTAAQLYETLKKIQEPQGYYFNVHDHALVMDLLEALLVNKDRYGYMTCPCRLASGDRAKDRDIMCPCAYRAADVEEYGSCYCGLYVSADWNLHPRPNDCIPERRPPEKND